jgi:hypothetical protein
MYKNRNMRPVETILGNGGLRENDGEGEFSYDVL